MSVSLVTCSQCQLLQVLYPSLMVPARDDSPKKCKIESLASCLGGLQTIQNTTIERNTAQKRRETIVQITCKLSTGILHVQQQATLTIKLLRNGQMRLTPQLRRFSTFTNLCEKII